MMKIIKREHGRHLHISGRMKKKKKKCSVCESTVGRGLTWRGTEGILRLNLYQCSGGKRRVRK